MARFRHRYGARFLSLAPADEPRLARHARELERLHIRREKD
ncbi:MAG: hypothetical protein NTX50_08155 [Candidatus Sumerlaeota bacterium]|nr:hypothetical protein [Candidatus Sumerlaeota bacterium]